MAVEKIGTDGNDSILAAKSELPGGVFDGRAGTDVLQLTGTTHDRYDLTAASLVTGFEILRGTEFTDYVVLSPEQIAGVHTYESGGNSWLDVLELAGQAFDLRNKTFGGLHSINLLTAGVRVTANNKELALKFSSFRAANTHVTLEGITLTADERALLHNRGIDFVTDATGSTSSDLAPQLAGLSGPLMMSPGQVLRIDPEGDATIIEDRGLSKMRISGSFPWHDLDSFKFDTSGSVDIVPGSFGDRVYVDGIEIGSARRSDSFDRIDIAFNGNATPVLVQALLRALTYEYSGPHLPSGHKTVDIEVEDLGGRKATTSVVIQYANDAPTAISLSSAKVVENAGPGMVVGTFAAQDPNDGDRMTWSLVDDAGGRFRANWNGDLVVANGTLLNFEKGQAHTITVRATDRGGMSIDRVFTISVVDVLELIPGSTGGPGDDILKGTSGKNILRGHGGDDRLYGLSGDDVLSGGSGNDRLYGALGRDTLSGGTGEDVFVFNTAVGKTLNTNKDRITDFNVAEDTIWLSKGIFMALGTKGAMLSSRAFWSGTAAHDSNDRIIYDRATGALSYDGDGSGAGAAIQIATLAKGLKLSYKDFLII
jgi:Ca2+-binding RTX toxin-like protein